MYIYVYIRVCKYAFIHTNMKCSMFHATLNISYHDSNDEPIFNVSHGIQAIAIAYSGGTRDFAAVQEFQQRTAGTHWHVSFVKVHTTLVRGALKKMAENECTHMIYLCGAVYTVH